MPIKIATTDPESTHSWDCNTVVYLGCKYGGGAGGHANDFAVLQNIWNNGFSKNNVITTANNQPLYYYKTYNSSTPLFPACWHPP